MKFIRIDGVLYNLSLIISFTWARNNLVIQFTNGTVLEWPDPDAEKHKRLLYILGPLGVVTLE